jgi:hypothetical protein
MYRRRRPHLEAAPGDDDDGDPRCVITTGTLLLGCGVTFIVLFLVVNIGVVQFGVSNCAKEVCAHTHVRPMTPACPHACGTGLPAYA